MKKVILILALCATASAQHLWTGVLDPARAIDWTAAGATISTTRTQSGSTIAAYGTVGSPQSCGTINTAIAAAAANSYVLLGAGTFYLNTSCVFQNTASNVTLRGSGSNATFLIFSGSTSAYSFCANHDICAASSDTNNASSPTNTATWSGTSGAGTYTKGDTSIILSSKTNLTIGNPIVLDQIDTQSDNSGLYTGCEIYDSSAACYTGAGPNSFERGSGALATIRGQQQIVKVTSITGAGPYTVGITPGVYAANYATGNSPGAWWATNPVQGVGIENLSFQPETASTGGIFLFNCQGCWVKGVRGVLASAPSQTGWGDVVFSLCNHCTVRDSYFFGQPNVDDYVVAVDIATDALVENNIVQMPGTFRFYNSDCEGCVSDYNFGVNPVSASSNFLVQPSDDHGLTLFSLSEGNIGAGAYHDSFHGTHVLNTDFRNRYDGKEQNNGNATTTNTVPEIMNPGSRYENIVGNILGTPGYHTTYKSTPGSHANYNTSNIDSGYYPSGSTSDALVDSTAMFWANWDVASNANRFCGNSSDTGWATVCGSTSEVPTGLGSYSNAVPSLGDTGAGQGPLPASFIYASKPSWWPSGKAWPPIGPDVSGGNVGQCSGGTYDSSEATSSSQCAGGSFSVVGGGLVTSIPAMDCYFNTMGGVANGTGSGLAFDSNNCFIVPSPPSGSQLSGVQIHGGVWQ